MTLSTKQKEFLTKMVKDDFFKLKRLDEVDRNLLYRVIQLEEYSRRDASHINKIKRDWLYHQKNI